MVKIGAPGTHTLKMRIVDPGIVLARLVVSHGAIAPSFLDPPESFRGFQAKSR
jgi:hypothetical protein